MYGLGQVRREECARAHVLCVCEAGRLRRQWVSFLLLRQRGRLRTHSGCAHVAVSSGAEGTVRVGGTRERPESWLGHLSLTRDAEQA